MKNNDLLNRIGKYSMAAGATVLAGNMANAAIQTTTTTASLTPGTHYIDFDGVGGAEIVLDVYSFPSSSSETVQVALGTGATQFQVIHYGPFDSDADAAAFPAGRLIGPTLSSTSSVWAISNHDTIASEEASSAFDGNFLPNTTNYLGVRYSNDGGTNWYYGWVEIQIDPTPLFDGSAGSIVRFAYEDIPNTAILAGAETTSTPAVPVSPLATGLGIGLIGLYGFYKTRRKLNVEN